MYIFPMQKLVTALQQDLDTIDPGIVGVASRYELGTIVVLTRQGVPTAWGVWFRDDGTMGISKSDTATLSECRHTYKPRGHLELVTQLKIYIDKGYI